jgi:hypothetical protein
VPLLNRIRKTSFNGHLTDVAFTEFWTASFETGQPSTDPHLNTCEECQARYAAFTEWMDGLRSDALAEADEVFTADRLAAQQAQVMRRLEALERPARVIAFPKFSRPAAAPQRHVQRWVASAAAAGLIIGLAAGQFVDIRDAFGGREAGAMAQARSSQPRQINASPVVSTISTSSVSDEDIFFGNMVRTAQYSTLKTMDDITPRARDTEQVR